MRPIKTSSGQILVDSVQHYAECVGRSAEDFMAQSSRDCQAYAVYGRYLILYNREVLSSCRRRWSIAHELGHICCRHSCDGVREEAEANAFAATLTERDALLLISCDSRSERLLETARTAREHGAAILLITCDRRSPLAAQADYLLLASNRAQRIVDTDPAPSLLSSALLVEVLYYLLLTGEDLS